MARFNIDMELALEPGLYIPGHKPVVPIEIDWSNDLADDLDFLCIFQNVDGSSLVPKNIPTKFGTPTMNSQIIRLNGDRFYYEHLKPDVPANTGHSYIARLKVISWEANTVGSSWNYIVNLHANSGQIASIFGIIGGHTAASTDDGQIAFSMHNSSGNALGNKSTDTIIKLGEWITIAATHSGTGILGDMYVDGLPIAVSNNSSVLSATPELIGITQIDIGGRESGGRDSDIELDYIYKFNRELSAVEIEEIAIDPLQLVKVIG